MSPVHIQKIKGTPLKPGMVKNNKEKYQVNVTFQFLLCRNERKITDSPSLHSDVMTLSSVTTVSLQRSRSFSGCFNHTLNVRHHLFAFVFVFMSHFKCSCSHCSVLTALNIEGLLYTTVNVTFDFYIQIIISEII